MRVCPQCELRTELAECPTDGRPTIAAVDYDLTSGVDRMLGQVVGGKYRLVERLGRGGYASVYKAVHETTAGFAAVKVIRSDLVTDTSIVRRFYLEAQNTHQLSHANTVRVSDFGRTEDGTLYLIMEFVQGRTLTKALSKGALPAARAVRIVTQILRSLAEAHQLHLIHRDVKPENIMLVDQVGNADHVKVLDFGISRSLDSAASTSMGVVGTPRYMAPEQWLDMELDGRSDLYAVGCILFQMLAGTPPFSVRSSEGEAAAMAYMNYHVKSEPPDLCQVAASNVNAELAHIVAGLLAKDPQDRPPNALAVLAQLNALDAAAIASLLPAESSANTVPVDVIDGATATQRPSSSRNLPVMEGQQRGPGRLALAVLAALVVGALGIAAATGAFDGTPAASNPGEASANTPAVPVVDAAQGASEAQQKAAAGPAERGTITTVDAVDVVDVVDVVAPAPDAQIEPTPVRLTVSSRPSGADVLDKSDKVLGKAPLTIAASDADGLGAGTRVQLKLPGHYPVWSTLAAVESSTGPVTLTPHVRLKVSDPKPGTTVSARSPDGSHTWKSSRKPGGDLLPLWASQALLEGDGLRLAARRSHRGTRYRTKVKTFRKDDISEGTLRWRHGAWAVKW